MRLSVQNRQPELQMLACFMATDAGSDRRGSLEFENHVCLCWRRYHLVSPPVLDRRVELIVRTVRFSKSLKEVKRCHVQPGIGNEYFLATSDRRGDWSGRRYLDWRLGLIYLFLLLPERQRERKKGVRKSYR